MTYIQRLLIAGVGAIMAQAPLAHAAPHATAADARTMLESAVQTVNRVGAEQAMAQFNQKNGPFNTGELYVFAFDMNGVYQAYGAQPGLTGKNVSDLTDAEGKPIVRDMIAIAKASGRGQINYVWLNRADNHVEHKLSLIERVGDQVIGVGYYPD